jgi:hypothetical protein
VPPYRAACRQCRGWSPGPARHELFGSYWSAENVRCCGIPMCTNSTCSSL